MADTVRSKSALQTLLATNGTNSITAQNVRDFLVSVDPEGAITKGNVASLPSNQKAGFVYLQTNGWLLGRDNATTWDYWGPIFPQTPFVDSGFSWVNQGSSTITTTNGGATLYQPGHASDSLSCYLKAASAPFTITVYMMPTLYPSNSTQAGLVFRESSTGKLATFQAAFAGGIWAWQSSKWTNATTFSANYSSIALGPGYPWLRITDDNSNRICQYSADGVNWLTFHTVTRLDFLTGGADQAGIFINAGGGSTHDAYATFLHYVKS